MRRDEDLRETGDSPDEDPRVRELCARMENVMTELRKVPGVTAAALLRRDGVPLCHLLPQSVDLRKVTAMAAALVGTAEMAAQELAGTASKQCMVESERGKIVAVGAGPEAILVTLVTSDANLGLILLSMEKGAAKAGEILATE